MRRTNGTVLLVLALLSITLFRYGRVVAFFDKEPPAFDVNRPGCVTLFLGEGFRNPGYHHFFDGAMVSDVIQMAVTERVVRVPVSVDEGRPLCTGEGLEILSSKAQEFVLSRFFVHAGQRITLGIPLRVDTMKTNDWQALPGIGPCLAERIVKNRQKNGEFADLEDLQRVRGIGPATIRRLKMFFLKREKI
jgi:competence protein ComEA